MKPILFVAMRAFVVYKGKVLLLRESTTYTEGANAGKYDVVGGRVHPGERFDKSLLREVKEETSLDVSIEKPFFVSEWRPVVNGEQWHIIGTFFVCHATTDKVRLSKDHDTHIWIAPEEYKQYSLVSTLAEAFEAVMKQ